MTKRAGPYNGHKNWNHWNVSLWIANDRGLYHAARDAIKYARCHRHAFETGGTMRNAALHLLAALPRKTPDGAPYNVTNVTAALRGLED